MRAVVGGGKSSSPARRGFLLGGFLAALAAAYGVFATFAIQFIFPKRGMRAASRIFIGFQSDVLARGQQSCKHALG